jgi:hypothetical protein
VGISEIWRAESNSSFRLGVLSRTRTVPKEAREKLGKKFAKNSRRSLQNNKKTSSTLLNKLDFQKKGIVTSQHCYACPDNVFKSRICLSFFKLVGILFFGLAFLRASGHPASVFSSRKEGFAKENQQL